MCNFPPLNVCLYEQTAKLWERIEHLFPEKYEDLVSNRAGYHRWCPSSLTNQNSMPPEPIYVKPRRNNMQIIQYIIIVNLSNANTVQRNEVELNNKERL